VAGLLSLEIRGRQVSGSNQEREIENEIHCLVHEHRHGLHAGIVATEDMAAGRATQSATPAGCSAPEYRQVDFWAGGCPRPS